MPHAVSAPELSQPRDSNGKVQQHLSSCCTLAQVIDFGLAAVWTPGKQLRMHCGSPSYAAPEIVARKLYEGPPVDVWSLGVVLHAMLAGRLPFVGNKGDKQVRGQGRGETGRCVGSSCSQGRACGWEMAVMTAVAVRGWEILPAGSVRARAALWVWV